MKIAIVGPSHPYKGGIVQQTTELAHRLAKLGHDTELIAWKSQFPSFLYPGSLLPENQPEMTVFTGTRRNLSWYNPLSWWQAGQQLKAFDLVIFVWWVPTIQAPIYNTMLRRLKGVKTAVICHNVLPHERKLGDKQLARMFFRKIGHVIVHTNDQARLAETLTTTTVSVSALPPLLPGWTAEAAHHTAGVRHELLFFGIVRTYKGLDVLFKALAKVPNIRLTVAGEFWGGSAYYETLAADLGITDRLHIHAGYITGETIPGLFQNCDALVLPYRTATGTTNVRLGFAYNVPVIASDIKTLSEQIVDGSDGLIFKTGDAESLSQTIQKLYEPATFERLRRNLPTVAVDSVWREYIETLLESSTTITDA